MARKRKPAGRVQSVVTLEPTDGQETITCPACHGTKIWELDAGLISGPCPKCNGTGRVLKPKGSVREG